MRGIDSYDGPMPDTRPVVSVFAYRMAGGVHRRQVHSGTGSPTKPPGKADGKRRLIWGEGLVARISDDYRPQLPVVGKNIPEPAVLCHVGTARLEETVNIRTRSVGRAVRRPYSDSKESDSDVWYAEVDDSALSQPTVDLCGEGCAQLDDFKWFLPIDERAGDLCASGGRSDETYGGLSHRGAPAIASGRDVRTADDPVAVDARQMSTASETVVSWTIHRKSECVTTVVRKTPVRRESTTGYDRLRPP